MLRHSVTSLQRIQVQKGELSPRCVPCGRAGSTRLQNVLVAHKIADQSECLEAEGRTSGPAPGSVRASFAEFCESEDGSVFRRSVDSAQHGRSRGRRGLTELCYTRCVRSKRRRIRFFRFGQSFCFVVRAPCAQDSCQPLCNVSTNSKDYK